MSEFAPIPVEAPEDDRCRAQEAGYDGMFGVYCVLPRGHDGPHNDGWVEWRWTRAVEDLRAKLT